MRKWYSPLRLLEWIDKHPSETTRGVIQATISGVIVATILGTTGFIWKHSSWFTDGSSSILTILQTPIQLKIWIVLLLAVSIFWFSYYFGPRRADKLFIIKTEKITIIFGMLAFLSIIFILYKPSPDRPLTKPPNISGKPKFELYLNQRPITTTGVFDMDNRTLNFEVQNVGDETATNLNLSFFAPFDPTNFIWSNGFWNEYIPPQPVLLKTLSLWGISDFIGTQKWFTSPPISINPNLAPVANPIELMIMGRKLRDTTLHDPTRRTIPILISIWSNNSETNNYCLLLSF